MRICMTDIDTNRIAKLLAEARMAGDEKTVADCIVTHERLVAGKPIKGTKAARRILKLLNEAANAKEAAE